MKNKKIIQLVLFLGLLPLLLSANKVIHSPDSIKSLDGGWDWAIKTAGHGKGFYIGYTIQKLMNKNSHIGTWYGKSGDKVTLYEIITGKKVERDTKGKKVSELAREILEQEKGGRDSSKKVLKDVAFLLRFDGRAKSKFDCLSIRVSNLKMHVDLKKGNIYWLGRVDKGESIEFLDELFNRSKSHKIKKTAVMAVSTHGAEPQVVPFLKKVFYGKFDRDLREDAIFWLGQVRSEESVNALLGIYAKTTDSELKEKLIFAFSQHGSNKATEKLARIAKKDSSSKARGQAIFWLGQKRNEKSYKILAEIYNGTTDSFIKEKLIFAFSQHGSEMAFDKLVQIAKKDSTRKAREQAIFWLGQKKSEKSLSVLADIYENTGDLYIKDKLIFAFSQIGSKAIHELAEIAKKDPDIEARKKAIFWLGQSRHPQAKKVLEDIINEN